jgi:hypothetical protein
MCLDTISLSWLRLSRVGAPEDQRAEAYASAPG